MRPDVCVVIPCYNQGPYLLEAVASVQSNEEIPSIYEIIVVDDGSTDEETLAVFDTVGQGGVRVIHQPNRGLANARNRGIAETEAPFIIPLDSDNRLREAYFVEGVPLLKRDPAVAVVYADAEYFGEATGRWHVPEYSIQAALHRNPLDACALFRRDMWERVGGYDEQMPHMGYEDWDFWIRVYQAGGGFRKLDAVAFDYRVLSTSMIRRSSEEEKMETWRYVLLNHPELMLDDFLVYRTLLRFFKRNPIYGAYRAVGHFVKRRIHEGKMSRTRD